MIKANLGERAFRDYAGMVSRLKPVPDRQMLMYNAVDAMWETRIKEMTPVV